MKIAVQTPLKNAEIIELLNETGADGVHFAYLEKQGIKMIFEAKGAKDAASACAEAKTRIKGTQWGKALYFSVVEL